MRFPKLSSNLAKAVLATLAFLPLIACAPEEGADDEDVASGEDELRSHPSKPAGAPTLPENYESLRAVDKQKVLARMIQRGQYCAANDSKEECLEKLPKTGINYYLRAVPAIFSLEPTFHRSSDEAPEGRRKIFHPFGVAGEATITFDYADSTATRPTPYSGLLAKGRTIPLIVRFAPGGGGNMIPGASVKFLIDGQPARNFVAIHDFGGLPENNWNYFTQDLGHIYPDVPWLIKKYFQTQTANPSHLPITHLGEMSPDGRAVPVAEQKTPYEIVLRPNAAVKNRFPNTDQHDFRMDLTQIEAGTEVYDLMARPTKEDTKFEKLGSIKTTSPLVASIGGDSQLYFMHAGGK